METFGFIDEQMNREFLEKKLNILIESCADLQGAIAGISIRSIEDGNIIYQHHGAIRLRPASNMKLFTAAAALNVLGEDYTFPTEIYSTGLIQNHSLFGDLFLKGKGDPTLLKADFDKIAEKLKTLGIQQIEGNLIGDDSWYDDVRYSQDLTWTDETFYYGAQISAITASPTSDFDAGAVEITLTPGSKAGDLVQVEVTPKTDYVQTLNQAITAESGEEEIIFERIHAQNTILVKGALPIHSEGLKEWIAVWDPTRFALTLFKQSLEEHGIQLSGELESGIVPDSAELVCSRRSIPLSQLLIPFMKLSNNTHAEIFIKEMGKMVTGVGSWENGLEVLTEEIKKLGVNTDTMVIRDGSGISHVNLISANEISKLLFAIQKEKWFPAYLHSLPVAGDGEKMVGGTLRNRMAHLRGMIKAKTGSISTVSTLSGYLMTKSGRALIFSIMLNNLLDDEKGKEVEDQMVDLIVNSY
ncbi:D-alanyl-D-alanine carboxypeptidase/D-alanyl-D-alanine endopeptidase [Neobacillus dielmonensis]|uniref:D-alanyl-D-alanine carboxypeptidase/D-alanyl-D-alanine endopeptidase n=1 Tax=Neobacillus dielmonensis TaxID=1347369 RepID=UPI0005AA1C43|nr:D-alanyl-D-alanine carboxypeptidase/D-alanyl-D-alanine-endopeptidase [Neobacillus dielmonensis]